MKTQLSMVNAGPVQRHPVRCAGLSLIEVIGVLAILVILTAAITPVAVRRIDIAAWSKETSDLTAISNALTLQVVRGYSIPGTAAWASSVASFLNQPVTNINSNPRKFQRLYLVDPNSTPALPYSQTDNSGTNAPSSVRVMIVSSIARTNVPPTINFNETWNWNSVLNPTAKPASWSTFPGNGNDVCIQRINLTSMFYQLVLVNRDQQAPGGTDAPFNINGYLPTSIVTNLSFANGSIWNRYYLAGSALGLWSTNGTIETTYILNQNASFVFENGVWNAQIQGCGGCTNAPPPPSGSSSLAGQYNQAAINFFNSLWNSSAASAGGKGAAQTAVLSAFGNFMTDYTMWADTTPVAFNSYSNNNNLLPMSVILQAEQGNVDTYTGTGQGANSGLLHH